MVMVIITSGCVTRLSLSVGTSGSLCLLGSVCVCVCVYVCVYVYVWCSSCRIRKQTYQLFCLLQLLC